MKSPLRKISALFLVLLLVYPPVLPALADDSETDTTPAAVTATIDISSDNADSTASGDIPGFSLAKSQGPLDLAAALTLAPEGTAYDTVEWSWSLESGGSYVAFPDTTDTDHISLSLLAPGGTATVNVTATAKGSSGGTIATGTASCAVTVQYDAAQTISLSPATLNLEVGGSQTLAASLTPSSADPTTLTWKTSNALVATAASSTDTPETATITAKGPGTATITAASGDASATCAVTVAGIALSDSSLSMVAGNTKILTAQLFGNVGTTVEWSSDNTAVAQVSAGTVTAMGVGNATITATVKDNGSYYATCSVAVKENTAGVVTADATAGLPLSFSSLESELQDECSGTLGSSLTYVTGLSVPTDAGILYYGYVAANETGTGVGSENYYISDNGINRVLDKISFVPSNDYTGSTADISYTGYSSNGSFFTGTIRVTISKPSSVNYTTTGTTPVYFQASDFNAICRSRNGFDLDSVTFSLPSSSSGTLYYSYTGSSLDSKVSSSTSYYRAKSPFLGSVAFVPSSSFSGSVSIQYTGQDTQGYSYTGRVIISVSGVTGELSYTTSKGKAVTFNSTDFNSACKNATGSNLDYVRFDLPSSSRGTLYYNYSSSGSYDSKVSSSRSYYRSSSYYLSKVAFVPASDFTGTVSIDFTGWSTDGDKFTGTVSITVSSSSDGVIRYSTAKNTAEDFDRDDFDSLCEDETGYHLNYVRFDLPSSSRGTLYYNYSSSGSYDSKVSSSKSYYRSSSPYLDSVTFVPASGYTGTVSIDFTGYSTDGDKFTGTVEISVGSGSGDISYSTSKNTPVDFDKDDFDSLCEDETDYHLNYVRFDLPSSSKGTLYYNYSSSGSYDSKVSSSKSYYRSSSPYLDSVTFVPASGYTGTVSIDFTGYSTDGDKFTGTVEISVGSGSGDISYSTSKNTPVDFDKDDFDNLCEDETDYHLNYVRFDLPSSSKGTLYYNYSSSGSYDSKVSSSKSYYRSSNPYLDSVTFVPASGYTGTVSIDFTGYSTDGDRFTGTVEITVGTSTDSKIDYSVVSGKYVTFDDTDFDNVCKDVTDTTLRYVQFELPSSSKGTLYYNYTSSGRYDSKVSSSRSYYRSSSPYLDNVTFVPASGYTGNVSIDFTGYNTDGDKFNGTVEITTKSPPSASLITYSTDTAPVTFRLSDFQTACAARDAGSFTRCSFALPNSGYGKLVYHYSSPAKYDSLVSGTLVYSASSTPSLSLVTFVPAAGFNGVATIVYTGQDSDGESYSGTVQILVTPSSASSYFQDLSGYSWAAASADYLYKSGITTGVGSGRYLPAANITRGDFLLMVCRAFDLSGTGGSSFLDVPSDSYYASAIQTAQYLGIAQGDGRYFYPQRPLTRQDAALFLLRAMQAKGMNVSDGSISSLSAFQDGGSVSGYAGTAMAAMVEKGILQGNSSRQLNPKGTLSRAEMAVILHRALTL